MRSTICEGCVFLGRTLNETNCFSFLNRVVNLNTENVDGLGVHVLEQIQDTGRLLANPSQ